MRGHVAPAVETAVISPDDTSLGVRLADGRHLALCLRCDCWIQYDPPTPEAARWATLPPLAELPKPRRGHPLHEAIVMRLIALNKGLHALGFTLLALAAVLLQTNLSRIHSFAERLMTAVTGPLGDTGQYASQTWLGRQLEHVMSLQAGTLKVVLVIATLYAVVEWTEAAGLWLERRWAEYLTVLATAGFLPLEIRELVERVTVLRVGALIVNLALIVWLVWNKRLFGVRGGTAALADRTDWSTVVVTPSPARGRPHSRTWPRTRGPVAPAEPMVEPLASRK